MLRTRLTLQPGRPGTKRLVAEYGADLVCVRYRYDDTRNRRLKTIELVVEDVPWLANARQNHLTELEIERFARVFRSDVPETAGNVRNGGDGDPAQPSAP
jgi:hypothetical protein